MTPEPLRVPDYLRHVLLAVQRIRKYTEDISEEDFYSDERTQDAVIRNIEVMGEAARNAQLSTRISPKYEMEIASAGSTACATNSRTDIFRFDLSVIWHTIKDDFPALEQEVRDIYEKLKQ